MLKRLRERAGSESGFTLVELLVVMLILGILAAIAIPAFFNQREKANDSAAKVEARSMQTAAETYATDNNGTYTGLDIGDIRAIEPTISATATAGPYGPDVFIVTSAAADGSGNLFRITRLSDGSVVRDCGTPTVGTGRGQGGCRSTATNGNYW